MATLVACASKDGEKVYVYNWGRYIDLETIRTFEENWHKVIYDEFEQNEECILRFRLVQ